MKLRDYIVTVKHPETGEEISIPLKILLSELHTVLLAELHTEIKEE